MPRPKPDIERVPVVVRFDPAVLAQIDALKGKSRAAKIADLIASGLKSRGPGLPAPEQQATILGEFMHRAEATVLEAVTFGPVKADYGARLKKPKGEK